MRLLHGTILLALWAAPLPSRAAEEPPHWSVHRMCAEAEAIVAAERIGPSTVRVTQWFLPTEEGAVAPGPVFEIVGLEEHVRVAEGNLALGQKATILRTQKLVCFLERKGLAWYALGSAREGSAGLVWLEGPAAFHYRRSLEDGSFALIRDAECASEAALRQQIEAGLSDRRAWEVARNLPDPEEKAVVLASYLLARTAPDGAHGTYRERVRQELPELGEAAVRELMELLRGAREGDELDPVILVLNDLGQVAKPALPLLLSLLDRPARVRPLRVLEALARVGDAAVAPAILPYLAHDELPVRAEAAEALAAFRYEDAARDIARSLPARIREGEAYYVFTLLGALQALDPARGAVEVRKYLNRPEMSQVANLLEALLEE